MATTSNTYTGNGSNKLFSITFPYLETTDIFVFVNGTNTTAYTFANATTIEMTTAPANGATVYIARATNDTALQATFFPGSSIKAADLNLDFDQVLYIAQETTNEAQAATFSSNLATTTANTALSQSAAAVSTANTASSNASAAVATANTANSNASAAVSTANTASSNASAAVSTANAAAVDAATAISTANGAVSTANAATSTANTALSNSTAAVSTANTASSNASAAVSTANTASSNASTAVSTANSALSTANTALSNSSTAISTANAASAAVASAVIYQPVVDLTALGLLTPADGDFFELQDSTGADTDPDITGVPGGLVGAPGLTFRLRYDDPPQEFVFLGYFANDSETRYLKLSGGTVTGALVVPLASASTPSLTFTGDLNTGIYSPGADQLAVATNGTGRLFVDANGQIGVGTAAPDAALTIDKQGGGLRVKSAANTSGFDVGVRNDNGDAQILQRLQNGNLRLFTTPTGGGVTERLRITSTGLVGIGTTSVDELLHVKGSASGGTISAKIQNNVGAASSDAALKLTTNSDTWQLTSKYDGAAFALSNGAGEKLRVDTSGRLLVGTSTARSVGGVTQPIQQESTSDTGIAFVRNSSGDILGSYVILAKSRGGSVGSNTVVQSGDQLGALVFAGADGTDVNTQAAVINAFVDGTPGANDMPGRLVFSTTAAGDSSPTERMCITSAGLVGIGTSSPGRELHISGAGTSGTQLQVQGTSASAGIKFIPSSGDNWEIQTSTASDFLVYNRTDEATRFVINGSGNVGIGTTSPGSYSSSANKLVVANPSGSTGITIAGNSGSTGTIMFADGTTGSEVYRGQIDYQHSTDSMVFFTNGGSERARIDSSGRLLVGTSSSVSQNIASGTITPQLQNASTNQSGSTISSVNYNSGGSPAILALGSSTGGTLATQGVVNNDGKLGRIAFTGSDGTTLLTAAEIIAEVDGTPDTDDMPGRLVFSTTADGASSPTERMRINSAGNILIGQSTTTTPGLGNNTVGICLNASGTGFFSRAAAVGLRVNRTADGVLVAFTSAGTEEGNISISGTTTSYNGAHLSRWSQLSNNAERIEILRGSVLSNIDEMCEWGEEDNEQLNRMKVSDVEGDKNVSGVFQDWDDDDETYTDDFYCAMTGDFIIRIAEGVTVERGDLLMSAGDGTAKPQDDDIIRSKTIAKVTSTNVSCTYEDGSYCVPCVLMAC